eukprot:15479008-Alexandrium_andersonii.AAC.1
MADCGIGGGLQHSRASGGLRITLWRPRKVKMPVVSGATEFKLRTPEAMLHFRAAEQPSRLCGDGPEPNRVH